MKNKTYKRDALVYLSALQFMAIVIKPAALLAFEYIDEEEKQLLREPVQNPDAIALGTITNCVIEHLLLQPLQTILREIKKLLLGGHYFPFHSESSFRFHLPYQKSWSAFTCLCDGNSEGGVCQAAFRMLQPYTEFCTGFYSKMGRLGGKQDYSAWCGHWFVACLGAFFMPEAKRYHRFIGLGEKIKI